MIGFFIRLGGAIALSVVLVSGLRTMFSVIDYYLLSPDSLNWSIFYYDILNTLPVSTAFFVVSLIALLVVHHFAQKAEMTEQEGVWRLLSRVVVIVVLLASITIVAVSGAVLLGDVLKGAVTLSSFFKILLTGVVGGLVFYYYLRVHRDTWAGKEMANKIYVFCSVAVSFVFVVLGIVILDPVGRADFEKTLNSLEAVQAHTHSVQDFYNEEERLPNDLDETLSAYNSKPRYSPQRFGGDFLRTADEIHYVPTGDTTYQLCAIIHGIPRGSDLQGYPYEEFPVTGTGEQCFDLEVSEIEEAEKE